jgi:hypothetical protein
MMAREDVEEVRLEGWRMILGLEPGSLEEEGIEESCTEGMEPQLGTEALDLEGRKEVPISKVPAAVGRLGEGMVHCSQAVEVLGKEVHLKVEGVLVSFVGTRELLR